MVRYRILISSLTVIVVLSLGVFFFWTRKTEPQQVDPYGEQSAPVIDTKNSLLITVPYLKKENKRTLFQYDNVEGRIQVVELPIDDVSHVTTSLDGSAVVLQSHSKNPGIYFYKPLAGTIQQLNVPAESTEPFFSPTNQWIFYIKSGDLYAINSSSKEIRQLTTTTAIESAPVVSHDGQFLAVSSEENDSKKIDVLSMNPDTLEIISSRTLNAWSATKSISHDNALIYLGDEHRIANFVTGETLYTFTVQDGTRTALGGSSWSADGTLLYIEWKDQFEESSIFALSADFSTPLRHMVFSFSESRELFSQAPYSSQAHLSLIP